MKKILIPLTIISLVFILSTCFFTGNTSVSVSPVIKAIGLPTDITSVELTVSGPGMNTIAVVYDGLPSSIDLTVPSGSDRTFELVVYVDTPIITATSFKGIATADLSQGNAEITLTMGVNSTKLVIPDFNNSRLLQFDDINDTTAAVLDSGNPTFNTFLTTNMLSFGIYDVDFDNDGRIYIAENGSGSGQGVVRVDNILGTNPSWFGSSHAGILALTVDRPNDLIYYSNGSGIYRSDLDGNGELTFTINAGVDQIQTIRGMAIDGNNLFVAGANNLGQPRVFKYDIGSQLVTAIYSTNLNTPWDVLVKDDFLYAANLQGIDDSIIIQLDKNLIFSYGYGIASVSGVADTVQDHFYGAHRFVAIMNKKITIMDEDPTFGDNLDKLVSIDDITGLSWDTLPEGADDGQSLFHGYTFC